MPLVADIDGLDYFSQLSRETLVAYTADNMKVEDIVDEIIALQLLAPAITKGVISNSIKDLLRSLQADGISMLRALLQLRDSVGGYIEIDNDRKLQWLDSVGEDVGQQIRYKKNLEGITRTVNYQELCNRVYCYGKGDAAEQIKLGAPGYIENGASQAAWGIYAKVFIDRSITNQTTLAAWAALLLAQYKDPEISYVIIASDWYNRVGISELSMDFEELELGSTVTVIDEDLGLDVSVQVVKIEHPDLADPRQMRVTLAADVKDITDALLALGNFQYYETLDQGSIPSSNLTDNVVAAINLTANVIDAARISLVGKTLDDIADGVIYERIVGTQITANKITMSSDLIINEDEVKTSAGSERVELTANGLRGYDGGVLQFEISVTNGKASFGGGDIVCDADALWVNNESKLRFDREGANHAWIGQNNVYDLVLYCHEDIKLSCLENIYLDPGVGKKIYSYEDIVSVASEDVILGWATKPFTGLYVQQIIIDADGLYPSNDITEYLGTGTHSFLIGYMQHLRMKETTTPGNAAGFGTFYTKNDNKAYFKSGDNVEHVLAYV